VADNNAKELDRHCTDLFTKRYGLDALRDEQALNFYPERAGFVSPPQIGQDFGSHLTTSYPVMMRRDLGNSISALLRPQDKVWFNMRVSDDDSETDEELAWLQRATAVQRNLMYDPMSGFVRATKVADHDYVTFGDAVISLDPILEHKIFLYRCWHLRDVVWCENLYGQTDTVYRKWRMAAKNVVKMFKGNVSKRLAKTAEKDPYCEIEIIHAVIPSEDYEYGGKPKGAAYPFVSVYYERETLHILREEPRKRLGYIIPGWARIDGSQYSYSPATLAALPDARLIQAMSLTLLEAGEKSVNPPLVAFGEMLRGDINTFAGGITFGDKEYDDNIQNMLTPLMNDARNLNFGLEVQRDIRNLIADAFFLNKLTLQFKNEEMTAYESSQVVGEFRRNALPLLEPAEHDYNAKLCLETFETMLDYNVFGPASFIPKKLQGRDIKFRFESPLKQALEAETVQKFQQAQAMIAAAVQLDPASAHVLDARIAMRDALRGGGTPAKWLRSDETVEAIVAKQAEQQAMQQQLAMVQQGAQAAQAVGDAGQSLAGMMTADTGAGQI
jgi:hypothetical protein